MKQKIKDHVTKYNQSKGFGTTENDIIETIIEAKRVWRDPQDKRRWWTVSFDVVEVDGMLIGFENATTDGDTSARERGWEFDPSTICEVEAKTVTVTVYTPVKE